MDEDRSPEDHLKEALVALPGRSDVMVTAERAGVFGWVVSGLLPDDINRLRGGMVVHWRNQGALPLFATTIASVRGHDTP